VSGRKAALVAVPIVVLLTVGVGGYLGLRSGPERRKPAPSSAATVTPNPPLSPAAATALSVRLRSGDADQVRQAVVLPDGTSPPARFVAELHRLNALTFATATFRDTGDGTAQVQAKAGRTGQGADTWTAYLVWESDTWKLSMTLPSGPAATP
jgi:hypothetical protein